MKPREKTFCRMMAIFGEPERAARTAGYKHPEKRWPELLCREDVSRQIRKNAQALREIYENTALSGLYRLTFAKPNEALRLLYREDLSEEELDRLDLSSVAEIKRTKDKSMEIKFFDRVKASDRLYEVFNSSKESNSAGGLLEAMRMSAKALGDHRRSGDDNDGV